MASPSSPPSPWSATVGTVPTGVVPPFFPTRTTRPVGRSATSAEPSARYATPQGTSRPVARVVCTLTSGTGRARAEPAAVEAAGSDPVTDAVLDPALLAAS